MAKSKITTQIMAGFAATMSLAGAGFAGAWPSPSLPKLLAEDFDIPMTSGEAAWIVSVFPIGCIIGSYVGSTAVDRCGRKLVLLSTILPHLISCLLIGLAQSVWWFVVARYIMLVLFTFDFKLFGYFALLSQYIAYQDLYRRKFKSSRVPIRFSVTQRIIAGVGTGMAFAVVPMYTGEIADDRIRGAVSGMIFPMLSVSLLITYCFGPWVSVRALAIVGGVLPLIFGLMFIWMPESPYYLIMKEKPDQAKKSLSWLRRTSEVSEELRMLKENGESERENAGTVKDLVMIPGNRKALVIVVGLMAAQQLSGITAVVAYSGLILGASGSTLDSSISIIILGVIQTLAGVLAAILVDSAGRRKLLLVSTIGSIPPLIGVAVYFQLQAIDIDVSSIYWLPVTAMVCFIVTCTIGVASLPNVVLSEIFPCNVKALAMMVANVSGALFSVAVAKLYQIVADAYGIHASFWGFAGTTALSGIFIYFMVPETKQRSLRDIQNELHETTKSKITSDIL